MLPTAIVFMRRLVIPFIIVVIAFAAVLGIFLALDVTKRARPAVVHLKPGVSQVADRDGAIKTTDKYVSVKTNTYGSEIFTWDQVLYISEKEPSGASGFNRVIDLIDFLSKFGLMATVVFFTIGLYQYRQSQTWEREKFLANVVKDFDESKSVRNARQLIDSLAQYPDGRRIDLLDAEKVEDRRVLVLNEDIYKALTIDKKQLHNLDDRAIAIRDCFDDFLSSLITFSHYIEQGLITEDALEAHVGYWINILGEDPENLLTPRYKRRIFRYAEQYGLTDVETLVKRYHPDFDWRALPE